MDMKRYSAVFRDEGGEEVGRKDVLAGGYQAALRNLREVPDETSRIEMFAEDSTKAGEVSITYWRQRLRR